MAAPRNPATGARTRSFRGPRRSTQADTTSRTNGRERLLGLDAYDVPKPRRMFYSTPGRGVNGELTN